MSSGVAGSFLAPALAHDVGANRAMSDLATDVDGVGMALHSVEIFGERFPVKFYASRERRTRNVFNALHQADQPLAAFWRDRCKPDAAVAHYGGGDPLARMTA